MDGSTSTHRPLRMLTRIFQFQQSPIFYSDKRIYALKPVLLGNVERYIKFFLWKIKKEDTQLKEGNKQVNEISPQAFYSEESCLPRLTLKSCSKCAPTKSMTAFFSLPASPLLILKLCKFSLDLTSVSHSHQITKTTSTSQILSPNFCFKQS